MTNNKTKDSNVNNTLVIDKYSPTANSNITIQNNNNNKAGEIISKSNTFNNKVQQVGTTLGTRISHIYVIWETKCVLW